MNLKVEPTNFKMKSYRNEGESCNQWCRCVSGTYCAPNMLCAHCDNICMNMDVVNSLVHYFNVGCLNCHEDQSVVLNRANMRFNKLNFDSKGCVVFPMVL